MKLALALFAFIAAMTLYGASRYVDIVFDGVRNRESIIEGFHYSIQAVTTVGYGNWEPAKSQVWKGRLAEDERERRMFELKRLSLWVMGLGAMGFGALIAVVSDLLKNYI